MKLRDAGKTVGIVQQKMLVHGLNGQRIYDQARKNGVRFLRVASPGSVKLKDDGTAIAMEIEEATLPGIKLNASCDLLIVPETVAAKSSSIELSRLLRQDTDEETFMQMHIDGFYKGFVEKVAEARDKTYDEIDKIAQGRIWSGKDALELGLVDEIGGLKEALAYAAEEADIDQDCPSHLKIYTKYGSFGFRDMMLPMTADAFHTGVLKDARRPELINVLTNGEKYLMMLPYEFEVK